MSPSESKFAVVYECTEARCADESIMTVAGYKVLLCREPEGWVAATAQTANGEYASALFFNTEEAARKFMRRWEGHPWYYMRDLTGAYNVIEVAPVYKQVVVGWKPATAPVTVPVTASCVLAKALDACLLAMETGMVDLNPHDEAVIAHAKAVLVAYTSN